MELAELVLAFRQRMWLNTPPVLANRSRLSVLVRQKGRVKRVLELVLAFRQMMWFNMSQKWHMKGVLWI